MKSTVNAPLSLPSCAMTFSSVEIELCRKPVVVVTTSSFFGAACKAVAASTKVRRVRIVSFIFLDFFCCYGSLTNGTGRTQMLWKVTELLWYCKIGGGTAAWTHANVRRAKLQTAIRVFN